MKKNLITLITLCLLILSGSKTFGQTCTELISNGDFSGFTGVFNADEFCTGQVSSWTPSHGDPQIGGSIAHSAPYYAYLWGANTSGEGISTNVSITSGKKYVLTYWYRKMPGSTYDIDHIYVQLVSGAYSTHCNWTPMPSPSPVQTIDHKTSISTTTWTMAQVCFTANNNYGKFILYPQSNNQANANWIHIDDVSIVEFKADAGPDKTLTCGAPSTTIGPSCSIPGATYSWSPSTGLNNPSIRNPITSATSTTTYTLTVTGPNGCSANDQVQVAAPACCLTAGFTTSVIPPCGLQFNNTSSTTKGIIVSHHWDFGDGTTSSEINPKHFYENPGPYNVCLTVVSYDGTQCCVEKYCMMVTSQCPNNPCTINPTFSVGAACGNPCKYTFTGSVIPPTNSQIVGWYWDFGDGTKGSGQITDHIFPGNGIFHVCLTAIGQNSAGCCTGQYCFDVNVTGCTVEKQQSPSNGHQQGTKPGDGLLKIYPNPTNENTTIEYLVGHDGKVSIAVYDIQGRVIKDMVNNEQHKAGTYSVELASSGFPAGTYICRVQINDAVYTEKVIVIK